ncbi:MAG TPA: hypothetical protein VGL51_01910 [Solirubrobacteraceae bacterium]|jgi:hypothetical protein
MRKAGLVTAVAAIVCAAIALTDSSATAPKAAAATPGPTVTTGYAVGIATTAERVLGVVNPNGQATSYYFQYGTDSNYGSTTPPVKAGNGTVNRTAAADLTGLTSGTVYHYRLVAVSASGTSFGDDQTFNGGLTTSQVRVLGREGFVSPGRVIGIQIGCFGGQTTCSGHFTVTRAGVLLGEHDYSIPPSSGGFHNFKLTPAGWQLVRHNSVFNLVGVDVTVNDSSGQTLHFVVHLARWVWH